MAGYIALAGMDISPETAKRFALIPEGESIQKGDWVLVGVNKKPMLRKIERSEPKEMCVLRVAVDGRYDDKHKIVWAKAGIRVASPVGAWIKKAIYQFRLDNMTDRIDAVAELKEAFLWNCAQRDSIPAEAISGFESAMKLFTLACNPGTEYEGQVAIKKAFDAFMKLNTLVRPVD